MTSELETELARLRLECKAKDDELNLLRGLVHAMREDLNVKNEQFDFLYTSLQASSQQWGQERDRVERQLRAKVSRLEESLEASAKREAQREERRRQLEARRNKLIRNRRQGGEAPAAAAAAASQQVGQVEDGGGAIAGWSPFSARLESLSDDVLRKVLLFCGPRGASSLGGAAATLKPLAREEALWRRLFLAHFTPTPNMGQPKTGPREAGGAENEAASFNQPPSRRELEDDVGEWGAFDVDDFGDDWRRRYEARHRTELHWRRGEAQSVSLCGHNGTVTCLWTGSQPELASGGAAPLGEAPSGGGRTPPKKKTGSKGPGNKSSRGASGLGRRLVSGSDDGSLVLWGLVRKPLRPPAFEDRPPPLLALAQLVEKRRQASIFPLLGHTGSSSSSSSSSWPHSLDDLILGAASALSSGPSPGVGNGSSSSSSPQPASGSVPAGGVALSHASPTSVSPPTLGPAPAASSGGAASLSGGSPGHAPGHALEDFGSSGGGLSTQGSGLRPHPLGAGGGSGVVSGVVSGVGSGVGSSRGGGSGMGAGAELLVDDLPESMLRCPPNGLDDGPGHYSEFAKLRSFHGHGGPVWCLAIDEEEKFMVSGSYDRTLKVWDLSSGSCLRTLRGHAGWVSCVGIVPAYNGAADETGGAIVSGSWDATIKVWDAASGELRRSLHCGVGNALYCLQVDAGRGRVAVGCRQRSVQVWDLETSSLALTLSGHLKEVGALHLPLDGLGSGLGDGLCSGSGDATVKLWDLRAPTAGGAAGGELAGGPACVSTLRGHRGAVMCVAHSPSSNRVAAGGVDKSLRVWDTRRPDLGPINTFDQVHGGAVFSLCLERDRLVSGSADGKVNVLNFNFRKP